MPSVVDICNLALSEIGDGANVAALTDPSTQAKLCNRFYPIALQQMLEANDWSFATARAAPALSGSLPPSPWLYAYSLPGDCVRLRQVLPPAPSAGLSSFPPDWYWSGSACGALVQMPQPFRLETDATGARIILTNVESAQLLYTRQVNDTTKFSGQFVTALAMLLASFLAGPIVKGKEGVALAGALARAWVQQLAVAAASDASQQHVTREQVLAQTANGSDTWGRNG